VRPAAEQRAQTARHRLAWHYLQALQAASTAFRSGYDHSAYGLALFDREWPQIQHWQTWSAARSAQDPDSARLCALFPPAGADLLALRQTPQERIAWLTAGRDAARAIGDRRSEAVCGLLLGWALHKQAATDPAEAETRAALALAEALGEQQVTGRCLHLLGDIAVRRGRFEAARQMHSRSLVLLRAAGDQAHLAEVFFSLSELAYLQGDFTTARDYAQQCQAVHLALGLSPTTNNNLTWLGLTAMECGDLPAAENDIRQSIALCRASGAQSTLAHALYALSAVARIQGDPALAEASIAESMAIAQSSHEEWLIPYILLQRADLLAAGGDPRAALNDNDQVIETARRTGYRLALSTALIQRAELLLALGEAPGARAALREGLGITTDTHMAIDQAHGLLIGARLWRQAGQPRSAAEWLGLLLSRPGADWVVRQAAEVFGRALERELGPAEYAAAVARGQALELEQVVAEILPGVPAGSGG